MIDERDHVFIEKDFISFFNLSLQIFFSKELSLYENFHNERLTYLLFRETTIKEPFFLEDLVLGPLVILPHGVTEGRPPEVFPSPPP